MLIDFNETKEITIPGMNGGTGTRLTCLRNRRWFLPREHFNFLKQGMVGTIQSVP